VKKNWPPAVKKYHRRGLPRAAILKVPHHGAANALNLQKNKPNYLDLCSRETVSILFAGDFDHPERRVEEKLRAKTRLACLINGLQCQKSGANMNPLNIGLPGAIAVSQDIEPCQPQISFEIESEGDIRQTHGHLCEACPLRAT